MRLDRNPSKSTALSKLDFYHLASLIGLAGLLYGLFHFSVFVTGDETRYAIGFKNFLKLGFEPENYELSFGFYWALFPFLSILPETYWPWLLNLVSALSGTILLIPLYFLIKSLLTPRVAFLTGLFLLFSPPFWLLTRTGHPSSLALLLFLGSMAIFNRTIEIKSDRKKMIGLCFSMLLAVLTLMVRADYLLGFLVPIGLIHYKEKKDKDTVRVVIIFYLVVIACYLIFRWIILGYILHPSGGTVLFHIKDRLSDYRFAVKGIIKNITLFVFGFLPVLVAGVCVSLLNLIRTKQWRCLSLFILWVGPLFLIFLPFWNIDFSRLSVPILIPLLMILIYGLDSFLLNYYSYLIPLILLFISLGTASITGALITKNYPFKISYKDQPIATVPLKSIFSDFFLRKEYLILQEVISRKVANRMDRDVVIITDSPHRPWYEYALLIYRHASSNVSLCKENLEVLPYQTDTNQFFIFVINRSSSFKDITYLLKDERKINSIYHINPFMAGMPKLNDFLKKEEMSKALDDYLNH